MELTWFTREEKVQDFDSSEQKIPTVSSQLTQWARIPVWERWTHKYCLHGGDEDWVTDSRKTQQSKVQTSPAWSTKTSTYTNMSANHVELVMNRETQCSTNCSWKYSNCWIQVLKLWRQEVWSIWWVEAHKQLWSLLWQATNYVNHKHILCVLHWKIWCWTVCSVDLQDFFIWSDPHATDAIFLQGFFAMTVPKGMMIMIYYE